MYLLRSLRDNRPASDTNWIPGKASESHDRKIRRA